MVNYLVYYLVDYLMISFLFGRSVIVNWKSMKTTKNHGTRPSRYQTSGLKSNLTTGGYGVD